MFSSVSSNSISFATVTPSFVIDGPPNCLSITTFLPLGPNVTFTAFAKASTPFFSESSNEIDIAFEIFQLAKQERNFNNADDCQVQQLLCLQL